MRSRISWPLVSKTDRSQRESTAVSPVVGPLRNTDGLAFNYFDANLNTTSTTTAVASVRVTLRGQSLQSISVAGRQQGPYQDSVRVRVLLRNN